MVEFLLKCVIATACLTAVATAQFRSTDSDPRTTLPVTVVNSNGTHNGAPALIISDHREWSDGAFHVQNGGSGRCDLVIENGGLLRVTDSFLQLRGEVFLKEGGTLQLIRTECLQRNNYPRQYNYWFEGGHLYTKDCTIGGYDNGSSQISNFWLNRGFWTARDTVVQHTGGILLGYIEAPAGERGGSIDADGLIAGVASDAIVMLGAGDATLRNSHYPIKMDLHATHAGTVHLDLPHNTLIPHRVYGDMSVHTALNQAPVDSHIPGSPWRLELENTSVPDWALAINDVRQNGPQFDIVLHNTSNVGLRIMCHDLTGSPTLVGPWRTYYPSPQPLPGLPARSAPGEHGIPPGCGIKFGNVTYRAPAGQWAYPNGWAFNFWGDNTNYTITGSMVIGELFIDDSASVTLQGDGEYNAGILAQTFDVNGKGSLTIRNATIGNSGTGFQAAIISYGRSNVTLENVTFKSVLLRTAPGQWWPHHNTNLATIDVSNYTIKGDLSTQSSRSGSISFADPTTSQNTDRSNLNFDANVQSGRPDYWGTWNVSGSRSTTRRQGSAAYEYSSTASSGRLHKRLVIPAKTDVELDGWLQLTNAPASGVIRAFVRGSSGSQKEVLPQLTVGNWVYFCTGNYRVQTNDSWVDIGIEHAGVGSNLALRCDDFQLRTSSWWEDDNLGNLDFEDARIGEIFGLTEAGNAPNHWYNWHTLSQIVTNDRRPGSPGNQSCRVTTTEGSSQLTKRLSFPETGQTLRFTGWIKPLNGAAVRTIVAEWDTNWWNSQHGNNVVLQHTGNTWQYFDITYLVPGGSLKADETALIFSSSGDYLIDDCSLEIQ